MQMGNGEKCVFVSLLKQEAGIGVIVGQPGAKYKSKVVPKIGTLSS